MLLEGEYETPSGEEPEPGSDEILSLSTFFMLSNFICPVAKQDTDHVTILNIQNEQLLFRKIALSVPFDTSKALSVIGQIEYLHECLINDDSPPFSDEIHNYLRNISPRPFNVDPLSITLKNLDIVIRDQKLDFEFYQELLIDSSNLIRTDCVSSRLIVLRMQFIQERLDILNIIRGTKMTVEIPSPLLVVTSPVAELVSPCFDNNIVEPLNNLPTDYDVSTSLFNPSCSNAIGLDCPARNYVSAGVYQPRNEVPEPIDPIPETLKLVKEDFNDVDLKEPDMEFEECSIETSSVTFVCLSSQSSNSFSFNSSASRISRNADYVTPTPIPIEVELDTGEKFESPYKYDVPTEFLTIDSERIRMDLMDSFQYRFRINEYVLWTNFEEFKFIDVFSPAIAAILRSLHWDTHRSMYQVVIDDEEASHDWYNKVKVVEQRNLAMQISIESSSFVPSAGKYMYRKQVFNCIFELLNHNELFKNFKEYYGGEQNAIVPSKYLRHYPAPHVTVERDSSRVTKGNNNNNDTSRSNKSNNYGQSRHNCSSHDSRSEKSRTNNARLTDYNNPTSGPSMIRDINNNNQNRSRTRSRERSNDHTNYRSAPLIILGSFAKWQDWFIDSGASIHSTNSIALLESNEALTLGRSVSVKGIAGDTLTCNLGGNLKCLSYPGVPLGTALYIKDSSFNLLSLGTLMKCGVSVSTVDTIMTLTLKVNNTIYKSTSIMDPELMVFKAILTNGNLFTEVDDDENLTLNKPLNNYYGLINKSKTIVTKENKLVPPPIQERSNFSPDQLARAKIAYDYHMDTLHPGNHLMYRVASLKLGGNLCKTDIDLMNEIDGECSFCRLGKMKLETSQDIHTTAPQSIGEAFYIDIRSIDLLKSKCVEIFLVCGFSGNISVLGCLNKQATTLFTTIMKHIEVEFLAFGHITKHIHSDHEETLLSCTQMFAQKGIEITNSAPAAHCALAERMIRLVDERTMATLLSLDLEWKRSLTVYAHRTVAHHINCAPNSHTYSFATPTTPFNLRTNNKFAHLYIRGAKFGAAYFLINGKNWRSDLAKSSDMMRQLTPKGCAGVCLGVTNHFNTKSSLFILPNGELVERDHYIECPSVTPEGWKLNKLKVQSSFGRRPLDLPKEVPTIKDNIEQGTKVNVRTAEPPPNQPDIAIIDSEIVPANLPDIGDLSVLVENLTYDDKVDLFGKYVLEHPEDRSYFTGAFETHSAANEGLIEQPIPLPNERELRHMRRKAAIAIHKNIVQMVAIELSSSDFVLVTQNSLEYTEDIMKMNPLEYAEEILAWAAICVFNPITFLGLSSIGDNKQTLKQNKKTVQHFSYKKAYSLDPVQADLAKDKELDKIEHYECFTDQYSETPDFSEGNDIKMYSIFTFRWKVDSETGEFTKMSGRLAIDGSNEKDVPDNEKATHTADQDFINLTKASFIAHLIKHNLYDLFFCNSFDVNGAFLHVVYNGQRKIYVQFPNDFPRKSMAGKLMLMLKAVYGVKRSNAMFNVEIDLCFREAGFVPLDLDTSIYVKKGSDGYPQSICFVHVDDGQMMSICPEDWSNLVSILERRFGALSTVIPSIGHVGVNTTFFPDGSFNCNQKGYLVKALNLVDPNGLLIPVNTPSLPGLFEDDESSPAINIKWYQELIGSLIYALITRHDIKKEVLFMAKKTSKPTEHDLVKVTRIFAYLKCTLDFGPTYYTREGPVLYIFVDASFNAHINSSRSHQGLICCIGAQGGPVASVSKMQTECICLSATESEYVALTSAAKYAIRFRRFLSELGYPQSGPTIIYEDCKSAVSMSNTRVVNKKSQHIAIKFNFVKELKEEKEIDVVWINREFQRADYLAGRDLTHAEFRRQRPILMGQYEPTETTPDLIAVPNIL